MEQWSDTFRNAPVAHRAPCTPHSRTGAAPATVAASDSGTPLCTCTGALKRLAGCPQRRQRRFNSLHSAARSAPAAWWPPRFKTSGGTRHGQGDVAGLRPHHHRGHHANNNVLTFADTTFVTGRLGTGTGVPDGATVLARPAPPSPPAP